MRRYLAWQSILEEKDILDLSPPQVKQAETQRTSADGAVTARLPGTYQSMPAPVQSSPQPGRGWPALPVAMRRIHISAFSPTCSR